MAPTMGTIKRTPSILSRRSPIKRRKLVEINSDANSSANISNTSPQKDTSCTNNINTNITADIQIAKVESIKEEVFQTSGTTDDDCYIIENYQTQTINLFEQKAKCRVCLTENCSQMFPLTSFLDCENNKILITDCLNVIMNKPISFVNGLPDGICIDCIQRVINAYLLIGHFQKNEEHLLKMISENINTSEISPNANTPKTELVSNSPKTSSSNGITDNKVLPENSIQNNTLTQSSRVLCQDCDVQMDIADIGNHLKICKTNHLPSNLRNGKFKVLVCRMCNTLVFLKNMKLHAQMCKNKTSLNTTKNNENTTNMSTRISPQKEVQDLKPNELVLKDAVDDKQKINMATTSQQMVNSPTFLIRVLDQGAIASARVDSKTHVSKEKASLPVIETPKPFIQRVSVSTLKKTDPCNHAKLSTVPVKQIMTTTTNGKSPTRTCTRISKPCKTVPVGIDLHSLENEIRKQLTKKYMVKCNVCFFSFTTSEHLRTHKAEVHQGEVSKPTVIVLDESYPLVRCTVCKMGFINNTDMMNHMKSQHT